MDIFDADHTYKVRVQVVVVKSEFHQPANRRHRRQLLEVQLAFNVPDLTVELLQYFDVELLLAGEVVIDHAFGGVGALRDRVHPCPRQPLLHKFDKGFLQNVFAGLFRVVFTAFTRFDNRGRGAGVDFWNLGH